MNEHNTPTEYNNFYTFLTVILSGLAGILISVPIFFNLMESNSGNFSLGGILIVPLFTLIGLRIGYLRRHNRLFFYISFFTVLILSTMIGRKMIDSL